MKIEVHVTTEELDDMQLSTDSLEEAVLDTLDMHDGFVGFNVVVTESK